MAATVKGKAIVWGVAGITLTAGIVSGTNGAENQSADFTRSSEKVEIANGDGETVTQVFYNLKKSLTLNIVPSHASVAATAATSADAWMPAPGTLVTVVDANGTIIDGDYNCISAKQTRSNTGAASGTVELEKYEANNVTSVTT